jgi:flagellar biosynthesis/type III secretory pathway protein FliH
MDFEIWNYPHVDALITQHSTSDESTLNANGSSDEPELSAEEVSRQQEQLAHNQALLQHLNLIKEISIALAQQRNEINETFLTNLTQLIKKITETVIRKELSTELNHERLTALILQATTEIQQDNEPCTIHVSTEQYTYFSSLESMPAELTFKADPTLQPTDFRIKTAFSEIESILDKHLHELFELQRE